MLLISGSRFIRWSNAFVFSDPEPPTINILYACSAISDQFGLCSFVFSSVTSSKLIVLFIWFYHIATLNIFFSVTRSLFVPYPYVSIESIDCILWTSFEFNAEKAGRDGWGSI